MAFYEFRCRECDTRFEVSRPMSQASDPATCPQGHTDTVKLLAALASVGGSVGGSSAPSMPSMPMGGGCGGGCACAH